MGLIHENSTSHWALSRLTYLLISPVVHLFSLVVGLSPQEGFAFSLHETWSTISSGTEGLYFSCVFGFVFFFYFIPQEALCFPSSCGCCTVVAWSSWFPEPWACCRISQGWDHPSAVAADPACAGSFWSQRLQQISGVMRREVCWLLKSSFPLLVLANYRPSLLGVWMGALLPLCLCSPSYLRRVPYEFVPMTFIPIVPFPVLSPV